MRTVSAFNRSITTRGVPAGAKRPVQELTSNPAIASATVGTSGAICERAGVVTAIARSLPERACGMALGMVSNIIDTVPDRRSGTAAPPPL